MNNPPQTRSAPIAQTGPQQRTLRIAVADDEPEMCAFLQKLCEHLGHQVIVAVDNGQDLIDACLATHPDLIITDVIMPEVDGLEALEQILRQVDAKAIVITAHDWP
ncbi:MAG: response regulator, partial [Planctomycetaceae bacterium]|nr:response regulator [Planctomycetaceae bacterium]